MMRIIKFRTFYKPDADFDYHDAVDLKNTPSFLFHYGDCELEQFTGLFDKNGKEIYEGDFLYDLEIEEEEKGGQPYYKVEYIGRLGCWCVDTSSLRNGSGYVSIIDYFVKENLEIMGNSYQNPELT
jgi:uncharacterized phage protein (TIGR01671 family)